MIKTRIIVNFKLRV